MFNYNDIGKKIKGLAKATFIVEAIAAVITGFGLWIETEEWWCALILFCGPIVAWVSSWLLYGYGEFIDKICDIEQNTKLNPKLTNIKNSTYEATYQQAHATKEEIISDNANSTDNSQNKNNEQFNSGNTLNVKANIFGECICPICRSSIDIGNKTGKHACPKCGSSLNIMTWKGSV